MANKEHLDVLKQGVEGWNQWRQEYPKIQPDLVGANLRQANLAGAKLCNIALVGVDFSMADLQNADLSRSSLKGVNLTVTNLSGANLSGANLWDVHLGNLNMGYADFTGADLSNTDLGGVDLSHVNLTNTNLNGAELGGVNLTNANLNGADFTKAVLAGTTFGDRDLRVVKGLETVQHRFPSPLSINTIYLSEGFVPEIFLQGTGVPDVFINYVRSLVNKPIGFYSCFISYSSKDEKFAERIYADLQSKGVRCWFAPEDLKIGDKIRPRIDESIRLHDKLLLVLSEHSVASQWVEQEVETALEKERKEDRTVLFPIRLDSTVMEIEGGWPALIRNTRNIGDFTCWKEHYAYQKSFERLLRDLKAEA